MASPAPLPCAALSPVSIDTLAWRLGGEPRITVSVRADLRLVPGGVATLDDPRPVLRSDHMTLPGPTFRTPRQAWPSLPRPEVTVIASAHANGAMETTVRFAMFSAAGAPLVDKRLLVRGRRTSKGAPRSVDGLLLDYCNAVGGPGFKSNPLGRGVGAAQAEAPTIFDPRDARAVASICPVPPGFAARAAYLGPDGRGLVAGDLDLPTGFDARFFQAAPPDQQLDALDGDERIVLEHVSNAHPSLETRLPGLSALARLYEEDGTRPLPLRLESIHVDVEAFAASLVWRATIDDPAPARPTIVVQVVKVGQIVQWPRSLEALPAAARPRDESRSTPLLATQKLTGATQSVSETAPASLPFARSARRAPAATQASTAPPGAPWAERAAPPVVPARNALAGTLDLSSTLERVERPNATRPIEPHADVPRRVAPARLEAGSAAHPPVRPPRIGGEPEADAVPRAEGGPVVDRERDARLRVASEARARREAERVETARADAERFARERDATLRSEAARRGIDASVRAKGDEPDASGGSGG